MALPPQTKFVSRTGHNSGLSVQLERLLEFCRDDFDRALTIIRSANATDEELRLAQDEGHRMIAAHFGTKTNQDNQRLWHFVEAVRALKVSEMRHLISLFGSLYPIDASRIQSEHVARLAARRTWQNIRDVADEIGLEPPEHHEELRHDFNRWNRARRQ